MDIQAIENELNAVSMVLGGIHECNNLYTYGLARLIWERGKPLQEMTIAELITLNEQYSKLFNELHSVEVKE